MKTEDKHICLTVGVGVALVALAVLAAFVPAMHALYLSVSGSLLGLLGVHHSAVLAGDKLDDGADNDADAPEGQEPSTATSGTPPGRSPADASAPATLLAPAGLCFRISSGEWSLDGEVIGSGYSGAPGHVNKATDVHLKGLGPLPPGWYDIQDPVANHLGPDSMALHPHPLNVMFGRGSFYIHADNASKPPESSSEGCIVTPPAVRKLIAAHLHVSRLLEVRS